VKKTTRFRPTCPLCGIKSSPDAEHCESCGFFLLIMPRAVWAKERKRIRAKREAAAEKDAA
jgi:hypothetical protein